MYLTQKPDIWFCARYRSKKKYPNADGRWDSVGGRINPGIALEDNLAREIKEEIGLILLKVVKLVGAQDILRVPGKHIIRLTYVAEAEGEIQLDSEECEEYGWFSLDEMSKLDDVDVYLKELYGRV